jgi:hypothetical protein
LGNIGKGQLGVPLPTLGQFKNPVPDYIPVARIADMPQSRRRVSLQRPDAAVP